MKTPMQDLKEDLLETITEGSNALDGIENNKIREACKCVLKRTIENIVKRIDDELLEKEKQAIIDAYKGGEMLMGKSIRAEQYYNQKYNK